MTREHFVSVRLKPELNAANFSAGTRCSLSLEAGQTAAKWADGSPITHADFDELLAGEGHFEIVSESEAAEPSRQSEEDKED